jgi:hypothetical protein
MPDLHYSEADGHLHPCEGCNHMFLHRERDDMADLNHLCRRCAEEVAAQLSADYNLPLGCSDDDRRLLNLRDMDGVNQYHYICESPKCPRHGQPWTTPLTNHQWFAKYGRSPHCFLCGVDSRPYTYPPIELPNHG